MKRQIAAAALMFLIVSPYESVIPQVRQIRTACEPFRVVAVVGAVKYDREPTSVMFFDLRAFDFHFYFAPGSERFGRAVQKGAKVDVAGDRCNSQYYARSVRRAR